MRKNIAALPILFFISCSSFGDIITFPGKGDIFSTPLVGSLSIQVSAQGNWVCSQPYSAGIVNSSSSSVSSNSFGTTSDGVFGLKYLPWPQSDTVVTLNGSTTTNRTSSASGNGVVSNLQVTWTGGKPAAPSLYNECLGSYPWNLTPPSSGSRGSGSSTANLTATVHVGPNAVKANTYKPTYSVLRYWVRDAVNNINTAVLPDITVTSPLSCTILPLPIIDFGVVNLSGKTNNTLLASKSTNLTINCTSTEGLIATTNVTTTFSGVSPAGYKGQLALVNDTASIMGYIRGRYITDDGTCTVDSVNEVVFDSSKPRVTNNVGIGQTQIPITWSLCSNDSNLFGEGTAQATVNMTWD